MWLRHFQSDSSTDNFPQSTAPITFSCTSQSNLNNTSFINTLQQLSSGESVPDTCTCANINIHLIPVPLTMTWDTLWGTCPCSYRKQHFEWFNSLIVSAFFSNFKNENISIQIKNNVIPVKSQTSKHSGMSLHQWASAFLIFISFYTEKSPYEHVNLLIHG